MKVAIAGGHGQIALRLERLLSRRGDDVAALIRNPDHADDVRAAGAEPVLCDLERAGREEVAASLEGAEAAVFAAGAGPGSGEARKETMDLGGAVKLIDAAKAKRVSRYVMISSMGADPDAEGGGVRRLPARQGARRRRAHGERARLHDRPPRAPDERPRDGPRDDRGVRRARRGPTRRRRGGPRRSDRARGHLRAYARARRRRPARR